ncbi:hypothetical protein BDZ97DRAFT_1649278, partial [Flammula alnicola]
IWKVTFKTINSTTLLLPAWAKCLEDLYIPYWIIPRDVQTHWNLTYDMLAFTYEHWKAINKFTGDRGNDLQQYELKENEWMVVKQLCDILEVHFEFHGMLGHC